MPRFELYLEMKNQWGAEVIFWADPIEGGIELHSVDAADWDGAPITDKILIGEIFNKAHSAAERYMEELLSGRIAVD